MEDKVLVVYGTKYGGTQEIADKIAQTLIQAGLNVDLLNAKEVKDAEPYSAVVLGSGTYIGRWRKEAGNFLTRNKELLKNRKVWLYSSGPTEEGNPWELMNGWRFPKNLQEAADYIQPQEIQIFHGVIYMDKASGLEKWMLKNVKAPIGDFRDWEAITAWAEKIAVEL